MEKVNEEVQNEPKEQEQNKENAKKEKTLGEKILEGRKNKHLSQEKFAELIDCTRQMVSRWELDQSVPRTPTMKKISKVLGISIVELIGEDKNAKGKKGGLPNVKSLNFKAIIKWTLIAVIIIVALYLLYAGYKFLVLNGITSKLKEYENLDNYHFKINYYIDNDLDSVTEVWYKGGLYKMADTAIVNDISSTNFTYLDINEGTRCIVNEQNKTYMKHNLFSTEDYENGKYMYLLFPAITNSDINKIRNYAFNNSFIVSYYSGNYLVLEVNGETILFDKESFLPDTHTVVMKENNIVQKNFNKYEIDLGNVTDEDVNISSEYKLAN